MKKLNFTILLLFLITFRVSAQSFEMSYLTKKIDTIFKIENNSNKNYFPSIEANTISNSALEITKYDSKLFNLEKKAEINFSEAYHLNFMIFSKYINEIQFSVKDKTVEPIILKIPYNGFSKFFSLKIPNTFLDELNSSRKIIINYCSYKQNNKLILGDFFIGKNKIIRKNGFPSRRLENDLFFRNNDKYEEYTLFNSYGVYKKFPESEREEEYKGKLYLKPIKIKKSESIVSNYILHLLNIYPFYSLKKIDKNLIIEKYKKLQVSFKNSSRCHIISEINLFIKKNINN